MSACRDFVAAAGGAVAGELRVPGDKSISHRGLILGALADGVTEIEGLLEGTDVLATLAALRALGVAIDHPGDGRVVIHGVGVDGLVAPAGPLAVGNAGTAMRLLAGVLAGQPFEAVLTGDASLSRRPMRRVTEPLERMGATIETATAGTPPLRIRGRRPLAPIDFAAPVASAQLKSAVLLAGIYAEGRSQVREPGESRDHTERMLAGFGYPLERGEQWCAITGGARLTATFVDVPADPSSAAFFLVAATIAPGSDLVLAHIGWNRTRTGIVEILQRMGADIEVLAEREVGGEPAADVRVRAVELKGIEVPIELVPRAIDEFPALFIAAACAHGRTIVRGAAELRVKESDRIQVMADGLERLGIRTEVAEDGLTIEGGSLSGGTVDSHGDHRVAMSFAVAALRASGPIRVTACAAVETSFPGFAAMASEVGLMIAEEGGDGIAD
jgi:3-phosphoshikimate 1-carboxyvinyltransferase